MKYSEEELENYVDYKELQQAYNPFFKIPQLVGDYLKTLPNFGLVHGSIYPYDRLDLSVISTPAVCVYIDRMEMHSTSYYYSADIKIKFYRNKEQTNRTAEYFLQVMNMENTLMNISKNGALTANVLRLMPYIHAWGNDASARTMSDNAGIEMSFTVKINYQGYKQYLQSVNYSPEGKIFPVTTIRKIGVGSGK